MQISVTFNVWKTSKNYFLFDRVFVIFFFYFNVDSDSEDEVESMGRFSPYENAKTSKKNIDYDDVYGNQSKLTICVFVSQGVLDIYPNARVSFLMIECTCISD